MFEGKAGFLKTLMEYDPVAICEEDARFIILDGIYSFVSSKDDINVVKLDKLASETNTAILILSEVHINPNFSFKSMFELEEDKGCLYVQNTKNTLTFAESKILTTIRA